MNKDNIIDISNVDQTELLGVRENKLKLMRSFFPKLKIVVRGGMVKLIGDDETISAFKDCFNLLLIHLERYNSLSINDIESLFSEKGEQIIDSNQPDHVLVYGNKGIVVKARTHNQRKLVSSNEKNDLLFAIGPAGTGKTYTAVALAVRALKARKVKKIILTRPAVEAGENLGFLPGDLKEKLDPYLQPLYDALQDMIKSEKLAEFLETGIIQIAPLGFMRGRTLDNAFVILDEGQNTTESQMKMFLTRMGQSAKFIITGDITQVDLPKNQKSGLKRAIQVLDDTVGIGVVFLDENDVIRHPLVKKIIKAFKE
ncbi:MAG: PhoH family protein [Flavobacteriales bacterium]|nr:PhoH family protein [Flavobacteriales bacterium]